MPVSESWLVVFLLIFSGAKQRFLKKLSATAGTPESFICRLGESSTDFSYNRQFSLSLLKLEVGF